MSRYGFIVDVDRCFGCYACALACRAATGGDGRAWVLQLESREEGRPFWIPYVCTQVGDPVCGFDAARGGTPPCARTCPSGALMYGDMGDPSSPVGRLISEGRARPLPSAPGSPVAHYVGRVPRDLEGSLPDPASVIPRRFIPVSAGT
ncbi:hypothetical protein [Conexivisphaera calida]|uniref:4Fe-4S ferredoxin-type domain-containing protein n=1 Tax=Conexivisphaera calida TaxID=1874277 RepID=A0A4P2VFB1_9ARCH|nr:hypothetical protein [Conexivisphaera calida]BBE42163.1 hypothetical protein NAS2_0774 [Conexivisphaera calida]